ncbi:MAG: DNA repair protein RadC [Verrucomicrobiales bacterium]|nr:DNA repair protein RadC [Verrucomicrobiales bacterium]
MTSENSDSPPSPRKRARIQDLPSDERPREKLLKSGASSLSDAELLALFFRSGTTKLSAVDLGRHLISQHKSLNAISRCTIKELLSIKGIGPAKASELAAAFELGRRLASERFTNQKVDNPEAVYDLLSPELGSLRQESLRILLLDTRYHLIAIEEVFRGSINECIAHPREILRAAIVHSAHAFILAHNHPSGDPSPSSADRTFTRRIASLASELQIELSDHVIIGLPRDGADPFFSFSETGLL